MLRSFGLLLVLYQFYVCTASLAPRGSSVFDKQRYLRGRSDDAGITLAVCKSRWYQYVSRLEDIYCQSAYLLLRLWRASGSAVLPWATEKLLKRTLDAIGSGKPATFTDFSYTLQRLSEKEGSQNVTEIDPISSVHAGRDNLEKSINNSWPLWRNNLYHDGSCTMSLLLMNLCDSYPPHVVHLLWYECPPLAAGNFWPESVAKWQEITSNALQAAIKAAFSDLGSEKAANASTWPTSPKTSPALPSVTAERPFGKPIPGVVAIVYEDFFSKASEVAVELLQVWLMAERIQVLAFGKAIDGP